MPQEQASSTMLRLSQTHLSLLETCPRKFQYSLLEHLSAPRPGQQQASIDWGNRFHLLMQQAQLGLPIERLLTGDAPLALAIQALRSSQPSLFDPPAHQRYESEHLRSFSLAGQSFSMVYDLLISDDQRAQILDWKTYPKPRDRRLLEQSWQTRLYCYGLVETSRYHPEQVSMTYWFVQGREQQQHSDASPEQVTLLYSQRQHERNHQALLQLVAQLEVWLADYAQAKPLPQISMATGECDRCPYLERCRGQLSLNQPGIGELAWGELDLGAIPEVAP